MAVLESGSSYEDARTVLRVDVFDSLDEPTLEELEAIESEEVGELEVSPVDMMASYVKGLRGQTFTTADVSCFQPEANAVERTNFMKKVIRTLEKDEDAAPRLRADGNTNGRKYWLASVFNAEAAAEGPSWFEANTNIELKEFSITTASELFAVRKLLRELYALRENEISELNGVAIDDIFKACNRSIIAFNAKIIDRKNEQQNRTANTGKSKVTLALYNEHPASLGFKALASCRGVDPRVFFPSDSVGEAIAKEVCQGCVVRQECLDYAVKNNEDHGVWGGLSERERRSIRKRSTATRITSS